MSSKNNRFIGTLAVLGTLALVAAVVVGGVTSSSNDHDALALGEDTPGVDETPTNGDGTPADDETPTNGDGTPTDETPTNGDGTPADDETPANGDGTPTDGETPTNGDQTPDAGETPGDETPGPDGDRPFRDEDPPIADEFPEDMVVADLPEVTSDSLLAVQDLGASFVAIHYIDLESGESQGYLNAASGEYVVPANGEGLPWLAAHGVYHERGIYGEAESVLTFWQQDGERDELILERPQQEEMAMSEDGGYLYLFDEHLVGVVVVDAETHEQVGEVRTEECGWDLMPAGSDRVYLSCWRPGEIAEVTVADGGVEVSAREQVFPAEALLHEEFTFASDADMMYLFTWESEVIPVDLSDGIPDQQVEPVSIEREGMVVVEDLYTASPDGERIAVAYGEGEDWETDATEIVLYDSNWDEVGSATLPAPEQENGEQANGEDDDGQQAVSGMAMSNDGSTLFVLHDDGQHVTVYNTDDLSEDRTFELQAQTFGQSWDELIMPWPVNGEN